MVRRLTLAMVMALSSVLLAIPLASPSEATGPGPARRVTVMTRNLYVGGDITRPVRAALGKTGAEALAALGHANHELRAIVDRTNFTARSELLADEIAEAKPDLIGLQEVALWRSGPIQFDQLGVRNATRVDYDFLTMLMDDLNERDVGYRVASVQIGTDVEAPAFLGAPSPTTATNARDVRLTVRDVVLVREHAGIRVRDSGGGLYQASLDFNLGGVPFSVVRGYAWADIRAGSSKFRFITTHLESQSSDLALAQAAELVAGPANPWRPTVLVCDCNSDPLNNTVRPGDSVPRSAAYHLITRAGAYVDQWLRQRRAPEADDTAILSEFVNDASPARFNHRIDMIFASHGLVSRARRGEVTGDELSDRDPATGLWPSDHAGVVLQLRLRNHWH